MAGRDNAIFGNDPMECLLWDEWKSYTLGFLIN